MKTRNLIEHTVGQYGRRYGEHVDGLHGYTRAHQVALDGLDALDGADLTEQGKRKAVDAAIRKSAAALAAEDKTKRDAVRDRLASAVNTALPKPDAAGAAIRREVRDRLASWEPAKRLSLYQTEALAGRPLIPLALDEDPFTDVPDNVRERAHAQLARATPAGAEIQKLEEAVTVYDGVSAIAWQRTAELAQQYGVDLDQIRREIQ